MQDYSINTAETAANLPPMLAPNKCLAIDIPLEEIRWPKLCSTKYNGIRATTAGNQWTSRSGKEIRMADHVKAIFKPILDDCAKHFIVRDGEFNSNSHNTVGQTMSILAGTIPMPDDFHFKCFYELPCPVWNCIKSVPMGKLIPAPTSTITNRLEIVRQRTITSLGEFENLIEACKTQGLEGFMLLDPCAIYKHNPRCTVNEQILLKYKYYSDPEDGKVIGLVPRQERRDGVVSKTNVFNKAEPVHTKDSFVDTDIAGCMIVKLEDDSIIHAPFPIGYDLQLRQQIHNHYGTGLAHDIEGMWISFRRLACENRDKPIAIKQVEFRDSKD